MSITLSLYRHVSLCALLGLVDIYMQSNVYINSITEININVQQDLQVTLMYVETLPSIFIG